MVKILGKESLAQGRIQQASISPQAPALAGETTLDTLTVGQSGVISHIAAEAGLKMHLLELGFVAGSPITYLMPTPFGDPHIYSLRGTSMALRKSEAKCIHVRM